MKELAKYESMGFVSPQLYQIKLGLQAGIDVTLYADTRFNWTQMEQIRLGLFQNLDVSVYAHPNIPSEEMEHIREKMEQESGLAEIKEEEVRRKKLINTIILITILTILTILGITAYFLKDELSLYLQNMEIQLSASSIQIEYNEPFIASDYLVSYTDADNVELILPDTIDTSKLGSYKATYQLKNEKKTYSKSLVVDVVDTTAPILKLNDVQTTIDISKDSFACQSFIESATDNVDGDLSEAIQCSNSLDLSLPQQVVEYTVEDTSHNKTSAYLIVNLVKKSVQAATPKPTIKPAQSSNNTTASQQNPAYNSYSQPYYPPVVNEAPAVDNNPAPSVNYDSGWSEWEEVDSWSSSSSETHEVESDVTIEFESN